MINVFDYLMGRVKWADLSIEMQQNAGLIVEKANLLLIKAYLTDKGCRSGFRRKEDHVDIYNKINKKRIAEGKPAVQIPWASKHLSAQAIDIDDTDDRLKAYLKTPEGYEAMVDLDLYQEDPAYTDTWVHLQTIPPTSGKRVFRP